MRKLTIFSVAMFLSFVTLSSIIVSAASGDLDLTFGTGGKVTTEVNGGDTPRVVRIQPDGKILIAGSSGALVLVRYNADGSLDTTYGTNGKIISGDSQTAFAVGAFQPDGKLVTAVVQSPANAQFRRFNTNGAADTTFGTNGLVTQNLFGFSGSISGLAIQPDGKIVAVGSRLPLATGNTALVILRLNADGTVTDSFSGFQPSAKQGDNVIIQADGKILVGGRFDTSPNRDGFLIRFNADGTADVALQITPFIPASLAVQTDGKILISGSLNGNLAIARFNGDVSLDTGFGVNGVGIADFGTLATGREIIAQNNNSIIVGGNVGTNGNSNFALARFQPSGFLEMAFGTNGKVFTSFGSSVNVLTAIAPTAGDKILAVGYTLGADIDFALARYQAGVLTSVPNPVRFDFDGDGRADISVFRPSDGSWYLKQSTNGFTGLAFGFGTDVIAPADYDGDGKTDFAVFRSSNGVWYIQRSTAGFAAVAFGQSGDVPVPGDFDDDGKADISVFRPSNGTWYRINSSNGQFSALVFGQNGDLPQIADFNGDSISDICVFRPSNGTFYWLDSITGQFRYVQFGVGTDIPVLADYDGDGLTDISVFRPSNGNWYRINSSNGQFFQLVFGQNGDIPAAADYDGNGKTDIALFRPSNGTWYFSNFIGINFGTNNDKPIPGAFR